MFGGDIIICVDKSSTDVTESNQESVVVTKPRSLVKLNLDSFDKLLPGIQPQNGCLERYKCLGYSHLCGQNPWLKSWQVLDVYSIKHK